MALSMRCSGVLLPVFSLPGQYGIGTFGREARQFLDLLVKMGFSYWQMLPLCPVDEFYSPYKSTSAFAGNPLFIDLEILKDWGLLDVDDLVEIKEFADPYQVNYLAVQKHRQSLFEKAYRRISPQIEKELNTFIMKESFWLEDYCLYIVLTEFYNNPDWSQWPDHKVKSRNSNMLKNLKIRFSEEISFLSFLQFCFYKQWKDLKAYANNAGIEIIGDLPIYVSFESADVWANPEYFQLDKKYQPLNVAGVPPDYFSETGQLWGNPLYNWDKLKVDNYSWWFNRLNKELEIYDLVRIDHFRGFSAYWSVPANSKSAISGEWVDGPGKVFFDTYNQKFDTSRIIAEDLGVQDENLTTLLSQTGFPGMRIMTFAFLDQENNIHLPHNYEKNMIAYTGTHDNNTILGSLFEYNEVQREYGLSYCQYQDETQDSWKNGGFKSRSCRSFIETLWKSAANVAILPIQDMCGFGKDTVFNQPGTTTTNWRFRITAEALSNIDHQWFYYLNKLYHRLRL
ncbi:4-alpha-glucanotransferase [Eubacteriaceae bacterium ES3]|nr:4-alpha-glucanotransferase [Eubacteriaceae bacterium ES3]